MGLSEGLYERIVSEEIEALLASPGGLEAIIGEIEAAEAPGRLAQYLAVCLERALAAAPAASRLQLANEILEPLVEGHREGLESGDRIAEPLRQLLALHRTESAPPPPPSTPLSANALFMNLRGEPRLDQELRTELLSADRVDLICAFIRWAGVRPLLSGFDSLQKRGIPVRVLTTTYTQSTEKRAVDALVDRGAEVRISYDTSSTRLHAKAWLFHRNSGFSTAYVGSSNLTHSALVSGIEWNVRLSEDKSGALVQQVRSGFETFWESSQFQPYSPTTDGEVLEEALSTRTDSRGFEITPFDLTPRPHQQGMLEDLEAERAVHGRTRNLVVAATGTGKTVLAALDYRALRAANRVDSLLFVAHRKEILEQSRSTFRHALREGGFGELWVDGAKPREGKHVFASIQSLAAAGRGSLDPAAFDMVIVDEFHHAAAPTYRDLLEHVSPKYLLGLTATPERSDGLDVFEYFGGRIAAELRLWTALEQQLLCPFHYYGVSDEIDLSRLQWKRGGYDTRELEKILTANDARLRFVLRAIDDYVADRAQMRALGFCVSVDHARYMADRFNRAGIRAAALTGDSSTEERASTLTSLREGAVQVIFAVDLFNEGIDIPQLDTLLFLRPTESATVFAQQLGRGLRHSPGKSVLTVLDFVGRQNQNFRFDERLSVLSGVPRARVQKEFEGGFPHLPPGCELQLDRQVEEHILENLRGFAKRARFADRVTRLRELGDIPLSSYLELTGLELTQLYTGKKDPGYTRMRRAAGFLPANEDTEEARLLYRLGQNLHRDDRALLEAAHALPEVVREGDSTGSHETSLQMLLSPLFTRRPSGEPEDLSAALTELRGRPEVIRELQAVSTHLIESTSTVPRAPVLPEVPLQVHCTYTRLEVMCALGESGVGNSSVPQQGVRFLEDRKIMVLFVTLQKTEKQFSPTTRYRDYALSRSLFHWESQSATRAESEVGQRYIRQRELGWRVLLFVREKSGDAFLCCGSASYVRHESERPIQVTWRLDFPLPEKFFEIAATAVA